MQKSTLISLEEDAGNEAEEILTLEITKPAAKAQYGRVTWYQKPHRSLPWAVTGVKIQHTSHFPS